MRLVQLNKKFLQQRADGSIPSALKICIGENKEKALGETLPESLLEEKEGIVSCTQHRILFLYSNYNAFLKKNRQYRLLKSSPERAGTVLGNKVYSLFIV